MEKVWASRRSGSLKMTLWASRRSGSLKMTLWGRVLTKTSSDKGGISNNNKRRQ